MHSLQKGLLHKLQCIAETTLDKIQQWQFHPLHFVWYLNPVKLNTRFKKVVEVLTMIIDYAIVLFNCE